MSDTVHTTVRMKKTLKAKIQKIAEVLDVPYQTLMQDMLEERVLEIETGEKGSVPIASLMKLCARYK